MLRSWFQAVFKSHPLGQGAGHRAAAGDLQEALTLGRGQGTLELDAAADQVLTLAICLHLFPFQLHPDLLQGHRAVRPAPVRADRALEGGRRGATEVLHEADEPGAHVERTATSNRPDASWKSTQRSKRAPLGMPGIQVVPITFSPGPTLPR